MMMMITSRARRRLLLLLAHHHRKGNNNQTILNSQQQQLSRERSLCLLLSAGLTTSASASIYYYYYYWSSNSSKKDDESISSPSNRSNNNDPGVQITHNPPPPPPQQQQILLAYSVKTNDEGEEDDEDTKTLLNWSGTHSVTLPEKNFYEPETVEELESLVRQCHIENKPLRPVGSALSPNAIAFHNGGMLSMSNLDKILHVDTENKLVTVQAGARVSQVIDELKQYGLTLPNLASIAEQQMGGFVQIGAHGTGAEIPSVDHFVTKIKLVTPALGTITLTKENNPLFDLARVGLGSLGVVTEITMQCIPAHNLKEHTFVLTRNEARQNLKTLLKKHKHMRYMWIPFEDVVVVVTNDPTTDEEHDLVVHSNGGDCTSTAVNRLKPLATLLTELNPKISLQEAYEMGFGELRDQILAIDPLSVDHVKRCNKAEAEFWRLNQGTQVKPSDQLLQFDCGGQQWVLEVCFPTGTSVHNKDEIDIDIMEQLLSRIEEEGIAAPAPIEQRWSSSSSSLMAPCSMNSIVGNGNVSSPGLHTWIGIIMYLPSDDPEQRHQITEVFNNKYSDLLRSVGEDNNLNMATHWAKLETPRADDGDKLVKTRERLKLRYPVEYFNSVRKAFDPKGILSSKEINALFSSSASSEDEKGNQ